MTNLGYVPGEPVAAIATALAPGAIGIVRTSGAGCIPLVAGVFSRPDALTGAAGYSLVHGWLEERSGQGGADAPERIDEVVLGVYRAPRSFTGEDMVEVYCHGGVAVVKAVLALLLRHGFRQAERGEFTFRAYVNGKTDLTRAEAVREIIDSKTDASRGRAAGRLAGSLFAEIAEIKRLVVDTLASIEVAVEYPEDEETIADSFDGQGLRSARDRLAALAASWRSERLYQDGARVVLCGRTNAGKSSLFNALLKEERAIVSTAEGTTRDWLESWADFCGIPVRLFDTAGLRQTDDAVEAAGVERARDLSAEADVVLYVVDAGAGLLPGDVQFLEQAAAPVVLAWNKCDGSPLPLPAGGAWRCAVPVSAKTGAGVGALTDAVAGALAAGRTEAGAAAGGAARGQAGLGSARQKDAVAAALDCVDHALAAARDYSLDAVVQDLEDALDALGEVTGEVTPDDVLESIFARFCVGK